MREIRPSKWFKATHAKQNFTRNGEFGKFLGPGENPEVIYTDNSLEFGKACEDLSWNHCTSTPHRSETNGIAERAVRRVKEGTSAVLLRSSLDENWWADSMEQHTCLRNIQDLLSDGKSYVDPIFIDVVAVFSQIFSLVLNWFEVFVDVIFPSLSWSPCRSVGPVF